MYKIKGHPQERVAQISEEVSLKRKVLVLQKGYGGVKMNKDGEKRIVMLLH